MDGVQKLSDEQLIAAYHGGDGSACEEVLNRYKNKVRSIARRYFLSGADLEDLVQEGMCGLYSAMTSFKGESGFAPYAHACIKNRIVDALKRSADSGSLVVIKQFSEEEEGGISFAFNPEDELINSEASRELTDTIKATLSKLEFRAVEMYVVGATMPEIASALNITYKQLDNALSRAKNKLKKIRKK